ncbi:MAG TPA: sulfite exporter TauE/SafE family protein [Rhodocyclaceae bacterium]
MAHMRSAITCLALLISAVAAAADKPAQAVIPTVQTDRATLDNGGIIKVSGTAAPGKPVFLEVWSVKTGRTSYFDTKPDEKTGQIPYRLYKTDAVNVMYRVYLPKDRQPVLDKFKAQGPGWSYSKALKETGADIAYKIPAAMPIDAYQTSLTASLYGSNGEPLGALDDQEKKRRSMQLVKARFRSVDKLLVAGVDVQADGSYSAEIKVPSGSPPAEYMIAAATGKDERSEPAVVQNKIAFPVLYFENAGTSINILWPFLLTLAVTTFGVLMGAGGGFILNPLLLTFWPLPHTIVAGTAMPTVLFSQASGIYNYNKIKFINWKLGVVLGLAMLGGAFIGPKLTELVSLDQFKFIFGWVLILLSALMAWQTTPRYLANHKKEQAILNEFKRRAEEAAARERDSHGGHQPAH